MSELCPWNELAPLDFIHKILEWCKKQITTFKELNTDGQQGSTGDACFFEVIHIICFENVRISLLDPLKHLLNLPSLHILGFGDCRQWLSAWPSPRRLGLGHRDWRAEVSNESTRGEDVTEGSEAVVKV
jgi:hypothetical protein